MNVLPTENLNTLLKHGVTTCLNNRIAIGLLEHVKSMPRNGIPEPTNRLRHKISRSRSDRQVRIRGEGNLTMLTLQRKIFGVRAAYCCLCRLFACMFHFCFFLMILKRFLFLFRYISRPSRGFIYTYIHTYTLVVDRFWRTFNLPPTPSPGLSTLHRKKDQRTARRISKDIC